MKDKKRVFKKAKKTAVSTHKKEKVVEKKEQKQLPLTLLICIVLFLIDVFSITVFLNFTLQHQISRQLLQPILAQPSIEPYPLLTEKIEPQISAQAAIIMDADAKTILYQKNPGLRFSMASTTKIMTALVGLEHYNLQDVLTVRREGVEGVTLKFIPGERLTFENILYAMLLPSANDAAYVVADNYPGGEEAFVVHMNEKAQELHLGNTHYGDPAGLNDDENYTTVSELAYLASIVSKQPPLAKIFATKAYVIQNTLEKQYALRNLNILLGKYGVTGIKTGFTEGAGGVLITSSIQNGHMYIVIVMKSDDRFADSEQLLASFSKNISYFSPVFTESPSY